MVSVLSYRAELRHAAQIKLANQFRTCTGSDLLRLIDESNGNLHRKHNMGYSQTFLADVDIIEFLSVVHPSFARIISVS